MWRQEGVLSKWKMGYRMVKANGLTPLFHTNYTKLALLWNLQLLLFALCNPLKINGLKKSSFCEPL